MNTPDLIEPFEYAGKVIGCEWYDANSVETLPDVRWQQVYVVANLENKVPIVLYKNDQPNLPGGKTEPGETIDETIQREIQEELNCRVLRWEPIGYQKLTEPGASNPTYQLRVYAELEKIGEFEKDSGGSVIGHEIVDINELNAHIRYGKVGERIISLVESKF